MDNNKWDLTTIFESFECKEFQDGIGGISRDIESLSNVLLNDDFDSSAERFLDQSNLVMKNIYPLGAYANLRFAADSSDEEAFKYLNKIEEAAAMLTGPFVRFRKWLSGYELSAISTSRSPVVAEHAFALKVMMQEAAHMLSEPEEILLSKLQNVGSNAWSSLQTKLTSDLMIEFELDSETKPYSLSMIRNFANHSSRDVRKRAYEAELKGYERIDEAVAAAVNSIKGEVNIVSGMRGFASPLEESAFYSKLDPDSIGAMISAIKEKLPVFRKYLRRKAELLGHQGGLPFYELFAPISDKSPSYTYEEAKEFIIRNFASFSDDLANFAETVFNKRWVDVEPRKGKTGGAFCAGISGRNQSRILTNYDGTFSSVSTLAHELGHGYHNSCLYGETMLNSDYPMPVAETASIFCETIITEASLDQALPEEAIFILEKSIENSTQIIVDILSRFIFETNLFEARRNGPLSVRELNELMINAQKESYGDGLDEDHLHPYMWLCKSHYYSSSFSFYNYPYAFGLLFAKGLYAVYKNGDSDFPGKYKKLLNNTAKMTASDAAATMGIDIGNDEFWKGSLSIIEDEIDRFIDLTNSHIS